MTELTFTPACPDDALRLAEIRAEAMRPSLEAVGRFDPVRVRARFLDGFVAEDTVLVHLGPELAGFYVLRERDDHLYLDHLYMAPSVQGRGIGRGIVAELQARGRPIRLMALNGSPANGFYRSCGFVEVSSDPLDTQYLWEPENSPAPATEACGPRV